MEIRAFPGSRGSRRSLVGVCVTRAVLQNLLHVLESFPLLAETDLGRNHLLAMLLVFDTEPTHSREGMFSP